MATTIDAAPLGRAAKAMACMAPELQRRRLHCPCDTATPEGGAPAPLDASTTPLTAPEVRPGRFAVQVSVLAKDGVQRAELHLNPAEMGPVSVQIVMDGTQARIDFGADSAATRQAIEAGLPELASALRDAGFTLAGGGVSQHSRSPSDWYANGRATRSNGRAVAGDGVARLRPVVRQRHVTTAASTATPE